MAFLLFKRKCAQRASGLKESDFTENILNLARFFQTLLRRFLGIEF
jgi:hypothetical protein